MNLGSGTAIGITGVLAGVLAGTWSRVQTVLARIASLVVVRVRVNNMLGRAVASYCWTRLARSPSGQRTYEAQMEYVRPLHRYQVVAFETFGRDPVVFWRGGWPLIVGSAWSSSEPTSTADLHMTFLRGTWDIDELLALATEIYNERRMMGNRKDRFAIERVFGNGPPVGRMLAASVHSRSDSAQPILASSQDASLALGDKRVLHWSPDELGPESLTDGTLVALAYPDDVMDAIEEARVWAASESWFRAHSVAWRLGWLLYGPPGSGKTALARALAQELDMPLLLFDLASMSNQDLVERWNLMANRVPCMVLLDDVDAVFAGRTNLCGEQGGGLTFDCLLGCIQGAQTLEGLFTVVTANDVEKIDPALGRPRAELDAAGGLDEAAAAVRRSTRPGRIDRVIHLGALDHAGRAKLAARILADCPEEIADMIEAGAGDTGAHFVSRCQQVAIRAWRARGANGRLLKQECIP